MLGSFENQSFFSAEGNFSYLDIVRLCIQSQNKSVVWDQNWGRCDDSEKNNYDLPSSSVFKFLSSNRSQQFLGPVSYISH